jgi:hypothetical protein
MQMQDARLATLPLSEIVRDPRLRFRDWLHGHSGNAARYQEAMVEEGGWGSFPPIVVLELTEPHRSVTTSQEDRFGNRRQDDVVYLPGTFLLIGGFTRTEAADEAHVTHAPAQIHSGTWEDALVLAWNQNSVHGKPRTAEETRMVLESIHQQPKYSTLGEREVAKLAGCSRATVGRFRRDVANARAQVDVESSTGQKPLAVKSPARVAQVQTGDVLDKWRRPVPQHLRTHFEINPTLDHMAKAIRGTVTELGKLKHGPNGAEKCAAPGLFCLEVDKVADQLLKAADLIDCQRPFVVCPHCDAVGCAHCNDLGWLTRPQADRLPPAMEKKAQAHLSGGAK